MFGALLGLWCAVLYFETSICGDSDTAFEVEYEVNSLSISILPQIDVVHVALSIFRIVISYNIFFIFMDSLKGYIPPT